MFALIIRDGGKEVDRYNYTTFEEAHLTKLILERVRDAKGIADPCYFYKFDIKELKPYHRPELDYVRTRRPLTIRATITIDEFAHLQDAQDEQWGLIDEMYI